MAKIVEDLTGQRFGKWTVLKKSENTRNISTGETMYLCECDCGTVREIRRYSLVSGASKSCGCVSATYLAEMPTRVKKGHCLVECTDLSLLTSKAPANNVSGRRGVWYWPKREKWVAFITVNKKRHTLGYFDSFDDAVKARELGEEKYFSPILERYKGDEDG